MSEHAKPFSHGYQEGPFTSLYLEHTSNREHIFLFRDSNTTLEKSMPSESTHSMVCNTHHTITNTWFDTCTFAPHAYLGQNLFHFLYYIKIARIVFTYMYNSTTTWYIERSEFSLHYLMKVYGDKVSFKFILEFNHKTIINVLLHFLSTCKS